MNRLLIRGTLTDVAPLRYSPAGVPIAEARLAHQGETGQAGQTRHTACELTLQAAGELAGQLAGMRPGSTVGVEGALTRRSARSSQLIVLVNRIEPERTEP